jgi:hypothetical protein
MKPSQSWYSWSNHSHQPTAHQLSTGLVPATSRIPHQACIWYGGCAHRRDRSWYVCRSFWQHGIVCGAGIVGSMEWCFGPCTSRGRVGYKEVESSSPKACRIINQRCSVCHPPYEVMYQIQIMMFHNTPSKVSLEIENTSCCIASFKWFMWELMLNTLSLGYLWRKKPHGFKSDGKCGRSKPLLWTWGNQREIRLFPNVTQYQLCEASCHYLK